jgi:hypothetical protein
MIRHLATVAGLEQIGTGAYARVYEWSPGWVLRISTSKDDGHRHYAKLAMRYGKPWMPVIRDYHKAGGFHVAVIERLHRQRTRGRANAEELEWLEKHRPKTVRRDIHSSNIMRRENGTYVITDPWSHRS